MYDFKILLRFAKAREIKQISQKNKIHPIYFSCGEHFPYLYDSLKSLERLNSKLIGNVYLYIDREDLLSKVQIDKLIKDVRLNIFVNRTKYKMVHKGVDLIINELTAFKEVSVQIGRDNYIAKVDSDVLFISDKILKDVISSDSSLIGQKYQKLRIYPPFIYTQGGCYFIKNSLIPKLTDYPIYSVVLTVIEKMSRKDEKFDFKNIPEDAVIFNLINKNTNDIKFINFYLPLNRINNVTNDDKKEYSIVHLRPRLNLRNKGR